MGRESRWGSESAQRYPPEQQVFQSSGPVRLESVQELLFRLNTGSGQAVRQTALKRQTAGLREMRVGRGVAEVALWGFWVAWPNT